MNRGFGALRVLNRNSQFDEGGAIDLTGRGGESKESHNQS